MKYIQITWTNGKVTIYDFFPEMTLAELEAWINQGAEEWGFEIQKVEIVSH